MYEKFKQLLNERGLTVYIVSKDTGIPQTVFRAWESGEREPKVEDWWRIADYLGVTVADFFNCEEREVDMQEKIRILSGQIFDDIQNLRQQTSNAEKRVGAEIMALNAMCNAINTVE